MKSKFKAEWGFSAPSDVKPPRKKLKYDLNQFDEPELKKLDFSPIQPISINPQRQPLSNTINYDSTKSMVPKGAPKNQFDLGNALVMGLAGVDALIAPPKIKSPVVQPYTNYSYNPTPNGTGSQMLMKRGGKVKAIEGMMLPLEEEKPGRRKRKDLQKNLRNNFGFSGVIDETGTWIDHPTEEKAMKVMLQFMKNNWDTNADRPSNNYRPEWQHQSYDPQQLPQLDTAKKGAKVKCADGMTVENDNYSQISPSMLQVEGKSHANGGTDIDFMGTQIEAEKGEPMTLDKQGNLTIFGALKNPVTNNKYKTDAKMLAKKENKARKFFDGGLELINNNDPKGRYSSYAFNAGKAMMMGGKGKLDEINQAKEHLGELQNAHLQLIGEADHTAANGKKMDPNGGKVDPAKDYAEQKASFEEILKNPSKHQKYEVEQAKEFMKNPSAFYKSLVDYNTNAIKTGSKESFWKDEIDSYNQVLDYLKNPKKYATPKQTTNTTGDSKTNSSNQWEFRGTNTKGLDQKILDFVKIAELKGLTGYSGPQSGVSQRNTKSGRLSRHAQKQALDMIFSDKDAYNKILADPDLSGYLINNGLTAINEYDPSIANKTGANVGHIHIGYDKGTPTSNKFREDAKSKWSKDNPSWKWNTRVPSKGTKPLSTGVMGDIYDTEGGQVPPPENIPHDWTDTNVRTSAPNQPVEPTKLNDYQFNFSDKKRTPYSNAKPLDLTNVLGEAYGIATNQQEPVFMQQYQPDLYTPYQVSFQDRLNNNNRTFNASQQLVGYNPEALSTLSAEVYNANNQVSADEFRTNQAISNDITNKNISLLNEAKGKNLQLADTQYVRQSQAKSNTKAINQEALNSISSKVLQNKRENNSLRVYENLYPNYRFDEKYNKDFVGAKASEAIDWQGIGTNSNATKEVQTINPDGTLKQIKRTIEPLEFEMKKEKLKDFIQKRKTPNVFEKGGKVPPRKWISSI